MVLKEKILIAALAVLILISSVSTAYFGIQMSKPAVAPEQEPSDDEAVVTLSDIKDAEVDYENQDFSDKIKDGVLTLEACGAEVNSLVDYGPLVRSAIRTAIENPGTVLEFQQGTYYVGPTDSEANCHFDFGDYEIEGLTIKGNGCTMILLDNFIGCFDFSYSNNVTVEGMTIDTIDPPNAQGTVTAFDKTLQVLTLETDRAYTMFDDPRLQERLTTKEANGTVRNKNNPYLLKENCTNYYFVNSYKKISDTEIQLVLDPQTANLTNNYIEVGDKLTLNNRKNTSTFIFNFMHSGTSTLKDITIYNSPGGGVVGLQNHGVMTLKNVQMIPDIRKGLWACGTADGVHVQASRGKVILEDCLFSHLADDAMNLYQWYGDVSKVVSSTEIDAITTTSPLQIGDTIEVIEPSTGRIMGTSKIKDLLPLDGQRVDRAAKVILEKPISGMTVGATTGTYYWYNKNKSFIGTEIRNCTFQYGRGRGLVLCTTDTVVENCTFTNLSNYAVQGWFDGHEGYELNNFVFRNNEVTGCNYLTREVENGNHGMVQISTDNNAWKQSQYLTHSKIEISGNKFTDYHGCAVGIGNCKDVTIRDNSFNLKEVGNVYKKNNALYISDSDTVTIEDNRFNDDKVGLTGAIRYQGATVKNIQIRNNSFACEQALEIIKE
ncbi:MAG: right-handed parallel beta-helix repeat-containing protein [Clostridia bacterium]|nr:right-handed parallel beta-helix repeat-containing protein [Clostridia bacterium]